MAKATDVNLKAGDVYETDEENEAAIEKLEKRAAKNSPRLVRKNAEGETLSDESVEMRTSDTSEYAARIADLEAQLAAAQANAKKSPRTAKPKMTDEEKELSRLQREAEVEAALSEKRTSLRLEALVKLEADLGLSDEQLKVILDFEKANPHTYEVLATMHVVEKSLEKKSSHRQTSSGDIIAKNSVVYRPYSEWKPTHHLSNEEVLAIVAEANRQSAEGKVNKAAIGRMFNAHGAMINNILTGEYYSEVTGIPKPAKKG
jgi:hypothetical protein